MRLHVACVDCRCMRLVVLHLAPLRAFEFPLLPEWRGASPPRKRRGGGEGGGRRPACCHGAGTYRGDGIHKSVLADAACSVQRRALGNILQYVHYVYVQTPPVLGSLPVLRHACPGAGGVAVFACYCVGWQLPWGTVVTPYVALPLAAAPGAPSPPRAGDPTGGRRSVGAVREAP